MLFSGEQIYEDTKKVLSYLCTYKSYKRVKFYMNTLIFSLLLKEEVSMTPPSSLRGRGTSSMYTMRSINLDEISSNTAAKAEREI